MMTPVARIMNEFLLASLQTSMDWGSLSSINDKDNVNLVGH